MILTKEIQEQWVLEYIDGGHSAEQARGFIDGILKTISELNLSLKTDNQYSKTKLKINS